MTWRSIAERTIVAAHNKAKADGKSGADIIKAIDAAYPFGERKYHPYKQWLDVRRSFLFMYGLTPPKIATQDLAIFADNPLFVHNQTKETR